MTRCQNSSKKIGWAFLQYSCGRIFICFLRFMIVSTAFFCVGMVCVSTFAYTSKCWLGSLIAVLLPIPWRNFFEQQCLKLRVFWSVENFSESFTVSLFLTKNLGFFHVILRALFQFVTRFYPFFVATFFFFKILETFSFNGFCALVKR